MIERANGEDEREGELLHEIYSVSDLKNSSVDESGGCNCRDGNSVQFGDCCDGGMDGGLDTADLHEEVLECGRSEAALGCEVAEGSLGTAEAGWCEAALGGAVSERSQGIGDTAKVSLGCAVSENSMETDGARLGCEVSEGSQKNGDKRQS